MYCKYLFSFKLNYKTTQTLFKYDYFIRLIKINTPVRIIIIKVCLYLEYEKVNFVKSFAQLKLWTEEHSSFIKLHSSQRNHRPPSAFNISMSTANLLNDFPIAEHICEKLNKL